MIETYATPFTPKEYGLIESGIKTQARFIIRPQPETFRGLLGGPWWAGDAAGKQIHCPFGKRGDLLFVSESLELDPLNGYFYNRDRDIPVEERDFRMIDGFKTNVPAWAMPRSAARLWLVLKDVRIQQLQNITEAEAEAEGAPRMFEDIRGDFFPVDESVEEYYNTRLYFHRNGFKRSWNVKNKDLPWDLNPYVWVLHFRPLQITLPNAL